MEFAMYYVHPEFLKKDKKKRSKLKKEHLHNIHSVYNKLSTNKAQERLKIMENEIILRCLEEERLIEDSKTKETNDLKASLKEAAFNKINEEMAREEQHLFFNQKFFMATFKCTEGLKFREKLHDHIVNAEQIATSRVDYLFSNFLINKSLCSKIMETMIVQTLLWLNEPYVIIRVLRRDNHMVQDVMGRAQKKASELLNKKLIVILDTTTFLPPSLCGGVQGQNKLGTIIIHNTFSDRVRVAVNRNLPLLKRILLKDTRYAKL